MLLWGSRGLNRLLATAEQQQLRQAARLAQMRALTEQEAAREKAAQEKEARESVRLQVGASKPAAIPLFCTPFMRYHPCRCGVPNSKRCGLHHADAQGGPGAGEAGEGQAGRAAGGGWTPFLLQLLQMMRSACPALPGFFQRCNCTRPVQES